MACCCENPLLIGCGTTCAELQITAVAPVDGDYELRSPSPYQQAIRKSFLAGQALAFDLSELNPTALHNLSLFINGLPATFEDGDGNLYNCLQYLAQVDAAQPQPTIPLLVTA